MTKNTCIVDGVKLDYDACADNIDAYSDVPENEKVYLGWGQIEANGEWRHFWKWID